jgi:hypothetical protein
MGCSTLELLRKDMFLRNLASFCLSEPTKRWRVHLPLAKARPPSSVNPFRSHVLGLEAVELILGFPFFSEYHGQEGAALSGYLGQY